MPSSPITRAQPAARRSGPSTTRAPSSSRRQRASPNRRARTRSSIGSIHLQGGVGRAASRTIRGARPSPRSQISQTDHPAGSSVVVEHDSLGETHRPGGPGNDRLLWREVHLEQLQAAQQVPDMPPAIAIALACPTASATSARCRWIGSLSSGAAALPGTRRGVGRLRRGTTGRCSCTTGPRRRAPTRRGRSGRCAAARCTRYRAPAAAGASRSRPARPRRRDGPSAAAAKPSVAVEHVGQPAIRGCRCRPRPLKVASSSSVSLSRSTPTRGHRGDRALGRDRYGSPRRRSCRNRWGSKQDRLHLAAACVIQRPPTSSGVYPNRAPHVVEHAAQRVVSRGVSSGPRRWPCSPPPPAGCRARRRQVRVDDPLEPCRCWISSTPE